MHSLGSTIEFKVVRTFVKSTIGNDCPLNPYLGEEIPTEIWRWCIRHFPIVDFTKVRTTLNSEVLPKLCIRTRYESS